MTTCHSTTTSTPRRWCFGGPRTAGTLSLSVVPRLFPPAPGRAPANPPMPPSAVVTSVLSSKGGGGWLVAGESLAETQHVEAVVGRAEVVAGPMLVFAMFFAALAIGLMASRPLEQARRRQLEFTADASHELRTPLAVIEAEVDLALSSPSTGDSYRGTLARIGDRGEALAAHRRRPFVPGAVRRQTCRSR